MTAVVAAVAVMVVAAVVLVRRLPLPNLKTCCDIDGPAMCGTAVPITPT